MTDVGTDVGSSQSATPATSAPGASNPGEAARPMGAVRIAPGSWRVRGPNLLMALALAAAGIVVFLLSGSMLPDPLGGPVIGDARFDKAAYGQAIGQTLTSFVDTHVNVCLALFLVVGFALNADRNHLRASAAAKSVPAAAFLVAAVLSVFFGGKAKLALMVQLQFDRISVELIEPSLNWQSGLLLAAVAAAFWLAYLSLRPVSADGGAA